MSKDSSELLEQALALSAEDRVAIADSLMDSLNRQVDEDAEQSWRVEIGIAHGRRRPGYWKSRTDS